MNDDIKTEAGAAEQELIENASAEQACRSAAVPETPAEGKDEHIENDERLMFLIPSVVALCFAITALLTHFGNALVDLNNTCYCIYVNADDAGEAEFLDKMEDIMERRPSLSGYTIQKNLIGGYRDSGGKLVREYNSYIIILMDVSFEDIEAMTKDIYRTFNNDSILVEEIVMNSYYMNADTKKHRWKDMPHEDGGNDGGSEK